MPRAWPVLIAAPVIAFTLTYVGIRLLGDWGPLVGFIVGGLVGFGLVRARWWIWRRRHPEITIEERLEAIRRAAPYN
jgi:hypothetical protein